MSDFIRGKRYSVLKKMDCSMYLTLNDCCLLDRLLKKIADGRKKDGKPAFEAVVVERDWPEFEPTWNAIECRVSGLKPCSVCGKPLPPMNASIEAKLDAGYPCPHAPLSECGYPSHVRD